MATNVSMPTVTSICSHSALDIFSGARDCGLPTLGVVEKGRGRTYQYYRSRLRNGRKIGCIDDILELGLFSDVVTSQNAALLQEKKAVMIPHRSYCVYVGYDNIESKEKTPYPVFGNRNLLRVEERNPKKGAPKINQDELCRRAGIPMPLHFRPEEIDRLCIVKSPQLERDFERGFFLVSSYEEYKEKSARLVNSGFITAEALADAPIEEYQVGAYFNFNFFYSQMYHELELIGIDTRRQVNLDGFLHLPAHEQLELTKKGVRIDRKEIGHFAATIRESMLDRAFELAEKFVEICRTEYAPGVIGPFALQTSVVDDHGPHAIKTIDVSVRSPGSPGLIGGPYGPNLFGEQVSMGKRIAMELVRAVDTDSLPETTT